MRSKRFSFLKADLTKDEVKLTMLLRDMGLAGSINDARRLITQGAVSIFFPPDESELKKVDKNDHNVAVVAKDGMIIKVGRKIRKLRAV